MRIGRVRGCEFVAERDHGAVAEEWESGAVSRILRAAEAGQPLDQDASFEWAETLPTE